jgi:hypothetical protein
MQARWSERARVTVASSCSAAARSTDYGNQARLVTDFWLRQGRGWDWTNRIVYLPKSP